MITSSKQIIETADGQYRVLFALLAGTGTRIGKAAGLHIDDLDLDNSVIYVRRAVWNGRELTSALVVGKGDGTGHFSFHKDQDLNFLLGVPKLLLTDGNQDGRNDLYTVTGHRPPFSL